MAALWARVGLPDQLLSDPSYVPLHIVSGGLALRFGFKNFLMITSLIAAVLTISFPLLIRTSYINGLVSRVVLGALHSGWFPGKWALLCMTHSLVLSDARSLGSLVSKRRNVSIDYDDFRWSYTWCYDCHITRWCHYRALWLAAYVLFFGWTDTYLGYFLVFFSLWLPIETSNNNWRRNRIKVKLLVSHCMTHII